MYMYVHVTEFDLDHSLDVAVNLFSMIGGEDTFVESCGGGKQGDKNYALLSSRSSKALEVQNTLHRIATDLKKLERDIIFDLVRDDGEELRRIRNSHKSISALDEHLLSNITKDLLKKNTKERGLILWINPGVSRVLKPEPIHLRQTLKALLNNYKFFDSTGFDVFDIIGAPSDAQRYALIEERLRQTTLVDFVATSVRKEIRTERLEELRDEYFPDDFDVVIPAEKKLDNCVLEIVQASKKIFVDILSQRMYATSNEGKHR